MENYIGRLLDNRYEILEKIGTGGMAVVYKARCHRLNRLVAIKILKEDLSQDSEFRRRFHAESQAVAMLSHPNIVNVFDVSRSGDADYIVMELIDGITLKQYMDQKPVLNWRETLHFGTQICKALEHAHSRGIIHRDIKPHNIMILKDGSIKVADFGIARISAAQSTLTREGLGSVHYISPEQAKGGKIDPRSDVYSLGVVLYEMLTGRPPYDGDTPVAVAIQHISGKATMPRELNPTIPEGLEQITMQAMQTDPQNRYKSATDMLLELEEFRKDPSMTFRHAAEQVTAFEKIPERAPTRTQAERAAGIRMLASKKGELFAKKNPGRAAWLAGAVSIGLAILCIVFFLYTFFFSDLFRATEDVVVPNFEHELLETIEAEYADTFQITASDWIYDDEVEYGRVIKQRPKADKTVKKGAVVELTVSLGEHTDRMPNVINYSLQNARAILSGMEVDVRVENQNSDVYVEGYVMRSEPSYGEPLVRGQSVTLVVSRGPETELSVVPGLVGMDVEDATEAIERAGLGKGVLRYVDSPLPKDTVTFQSIDQGESVKKDTTINLQVSNGNLSVGEAEKPEISSILPPEADATVGETVTLTISASTGDGGRLSYAWYCSQTGKTDDLLLVQNTSEKHSYDVSAKTAGTFYYCCEVINTRNNHASSVYSDFAKVTVKAKLIAKVIRYRLPEGSGTAMLVVKIGGENYGTPIEVTLGTGILQLEVAGSGKQTVDIYLDGILVATETIDFGA